MDLHYSILESEAVQNHTGKVNVKILLSNKNEYDWGDNVKIKGLKNQEELR